MKHYGLLLALLSLSLNVFAQSSRPNFLIIQVDDMGYDDLSVNGNTVSNTPTLDELANESVRFNNFMVHSVCAPTRASFLTGRDFWRTGVSAMHGGKDYLNLDETTFADILSDSGYVTGMWGKWHSGKADGYWPWDRGFDEAYYAKLYNYFPSTGWHNSYDYYRNIVEHEDKWSAEVLADYTIDFIDRHKDTTFLAYLSFLTVHETWAAPEAYIAKYREEGRTEKFATLLAMLEYMDVQVERVLQHLSGLGLDENTVVLFMSDNGPNLTVTTAEEWVLRNNHGFLGNKSRLWQNGIKSPLYVRWKDRYVPGDVNRLSCVTDIFPTLLDIAGIALPESNKPLDGRSIRTFLEGDTLSLEPGSGVFAHWFPIWEQDQYHPVSEEQRLAMDFDDQRITLISEEYKYLMNPVNVSGSPAKVNGDVLIDLLADPMESNNVISENPEVAGEMLQKLRDWFNEIRSTPGAFNAPVHQIGLEEKSRYEILAMNPSAVNGVVNESHGISGYDQVGDAGSYDLFVHRPGVYRINFDAAGSKLAGYTFTASVGESRIDKELASSSNQDLGEVILPQGEQSISFTLSAIDPSQSPEFGSITRYWLYYQGPIPPKPEDFVLHTSESICLEDSIFFGGEWLNEAGEYRDTLTYTYYADTIFILDLQVEHCKPPDVIVRSDTLICKGDSVLFRGSWYMETGRYKDTVPSELEADTIFRFTLLTEECVFVQDSKAVSDITVFPNPADELAVVHSNNGEPFDLSMYSLDGKCLQEQKGQSEYKVDARFYPPGSYILKIKTKEAILTRTLMLN